MIAHYLNNQTNFDHYSATALQALCNGQYIRLEPKDNTLSLAIISRPNGWRRWVRWLLPCLFSPQENEKFQVVSSFMLNLFETNRCFLSNHTSSLVHLKKRWERKDAIIGKRLQILIDQQNENLSVKIQNSRQQWQKENETLESLRASVHNLREEMRDLRSERQSLRNTNQAEESILSRLKADNVVERENWRREKIENQSKLNISRQLAGRETQQLESLREKRQEILSTLQSHTKKQLEVFKEQSDRLNSSTTYHDQSFLMVAQKMKMMDCILLSSDAMPIKACSASLKRFRFFQSYFENGFLESKNNGSLDLEVESKEKQDVPTIKINLSGKKLETGELLLTPGFSSATLETFLDYAYTGRIPRSCATLEALCHLFLLGDYISSEELRMDCFFALDKVFLSTSPMEACELHVNTILRPPVNHEKLENYFAQKYLVYIWWNNGNEGVKAKFSPAKQQELYELFHARFTSAREEVQKVKIDAFSGETNLERWDCSDDRVSIYAMLLAMSSYLELGTEMNQEQIIELWTIARMRNYAPALAQSFNIESSPYPSEKGFAECFKAYYELKFEPAGIGLATSYNIGQGTPQNTAKAIRLWLEVGMKGYALAYHGLWESLQDISYLEMAAHMGLPPAAVKMARNASNMGKKAEALTWALWAQQIGTTSNIVQEVTDKG